MAQTIIEKIFQEHSEDQVAPGRVIWLDLDVRTARDFGGPNVVKHLRRQYPQGEQVADPQRTYFTFDLSVPAKTIKYAVSQQVCRTFARETGTAVFDVDEGIGTHVLMEKGIVTPGSTAVGTDSDYNILGAIGAFGQGMGDQDIAFAFKTGRTWFEVPATMRIDVEGTYTWPATARDLTFAVMGQLGSSGMLGKAAEYYGPAVDALNVDGRVTLASQTTEMGGIIAFIPPNDEVLNWVSSRAGREVRGVYADPDATYESTVTVDVQDLEPLVATPPRPTDVVPASTLSDLEIDSVFIGSCTNGRFEDMAMVARILKGRRVKEGVTLRITPASKEVWARVIREGLIDVFIKAGATVFTNPGCGGCAEGMAGMVGEGEVALSTTNRNYRGKQGPGEIYLVSPVVAAASAVTGKLTAPDQLEVGA
ncbi:MAG: aconitase/3-isopropylmalate dehydratase large subunit family protein [Candidatus Thermoplasmatota archaeon]|nr:aconitase/3-isopropylmalate dehydratase large subunit family protein [Candidatus Thermoplasmatota archaeon]